MTDELIKLMTREIATKINKKVNIPFIGEEQEQILFEAIVQVVLDLIFSGKFFRMYQKLAEKTMKK